MYVANNSVVFIFPLTFKLPVIVSLPINDKFPIMFVEPLRFVLPVTFNPPLMDVFTFTTNPLFGEIPAIAEPDLSWFISPIADALILNNPLPSPLKRDEDIEDETLSEPVI